MHDVVLNVFEGRVNGSWKDENSSHGDSESGL